MAPIRDGREEQLSAVLQAMGSGRDSPFARVGSTHFARFVLIPALLDGRGEPVGPARSYLLFTADFDGRRRCWLRAVAKQIGSELDLVFRHCVDYQGSADPRSFEAFMRQYSVGVGFSVISYRATTGEIRDSLELQGKLREFAAAARDLTPRELQSEWRRRFAA
jgi:hypothetical protein